MNRIKGQLTNLLRGGNSATAVLLAVASRFLVVAANTATGVITARALQPQGRGEMAALILWPIFWSSALTLGLPSALIFNLKRAPERESQLLGAALWMGLWMGLLAAIAGIVMMPVLLSGYASETIQAARLIMLHSPLCLLILIARAALEARGDFRGSNATWLVTPLLALVGLSVMAMTGRLTPLRAALAYVFNGFPVYLWLAVRLWQLYRPGLRGWLRSSGELIRYGIRAYGVDLLAAMAQQIDQVMLVGLLAPAALGAYVVASSLARMLQLFQQAFVMVLFPKAASLPAEEVVALTGRAVRVSTGLTALAGAVVALCGPWLLGFLYGADFVAASGLLRLLVLDATLSSATFVLGQAFMALGRPGVVTVLQGAGLAFCAMFMPTCIAKFGLPGAGLALVCGSAIRLCLMLFSFPRLLQQRAPRLLAGRDDLNFLWRKLARA